MKKIGILFTLLVVLMTSFVFAQVEEGSTCKIFVSGKEGESVEVTAEIRDFTDTGRLRIRVRNRIRNEDIEILYIEVTGKNARGNAITRTYTGSDIRMPEGYDGIIPRNERVDIEIRGITIMRSVSSVTVYSDICKY
jgi:hypothetical protein